MRVRIHAEALTAIREKDGLTMAALAAAAGISRGYLNDIEKQRGGGPVPRPWVRKALADALKVPLSAIEIPVADIEAPEPPGQRAA